MKRGIVLLLVLLVLIPVSYSSPLYIQKILDNIVIGTTGCASIEERIDILKTYDIVMTLYNPNHYEYWFEGPEESMDELLIALIESGFRDEQILQILSFIIGYSGIERYVIENFPDFVRELTELNYSPGQILQVLNNFDLEIYIVDVLREFPKLLELGKSEGEIYSLFSEVINSVYESRIMDYLSVFIENDYSLEDIDFLMLSLDGPFEAKDSYILRYKFSDDLSINFDVYISHLPKDRIIEVLSLIRDNLINEGSRYGTSRHRGEVLTKALPDFMRVLDEKDYSKEGIAYFVKELLIHEGSFEHNNFNTVRMINFAKFFVERDVPQDTILVLMNSMYFAFYVEDRSGPEYGECGSKEEGFYGFILDDFKELVHVMYVKGFSDEEVSSFSVSLCDMMDSQKRANVDKWYFAFGFRDTIHFAASMINSGLAIEEINSLILESLDIYGGSHDSFFIAASYLIENGFSFNDINNMVNRIGDLGEYTKRRVLKNIPLCGISTEEKFNSYLFLLDFSLPDYSDIFNLICRELKGNGFVLDFNFFDRDGLITEVYNKININLNSFDGSNPFLTNQLSVLINTLHDIENSPDDIIRETISKNIDLKPIYYLMSLGGADMYTSTFLKLHYINFKEGSGDYAFGSPRFPDFLNEIKNSIDTNSEYMADFILTLANFDKLKEIIDEDPEFILGAIEEVLSEEDNDELKENIPKLYSTIEWLLNNAVYQSRIGNFLLSKYEEYVGSDDLVKLHLYIYLIKSVCELDENGNAISCNKFSNSEEVKAIVDLYRPILKPIVFKGWLDDNILTAKLYFTQEGQIYKTKNNYENLFEFEVVDEFSQDSRVHTYILEPKLDVNNYGYTNGLVNGVKFKLILTEKTGDVQEAINSMDVDIIGHRGHSYSELKIFSPDIISGGIKLIYLGGCGGFGRVPIIQQTLPNMYYFSDSDTGYGDDNDRILFYTLRAIAQMKNQEKIGWDEVRQNVEESYANRVLPYPSGIIYPDHEGLLLNPYLNLAQDIAIR